jgi:hypothetical protein
MVAARAKDINDKAETMRVVEKIILRDVVSEGLGE